MQAAQLAEPLRQARELIVGKVEPSQAAQLAEPLRQARELIAGKIEPLQAAQLAERLRKGREPQPRQIQSPRLLAQRRLDARFGDLVGGFRLSLR